MLQPRDLIELARSLQGIPVLHCPGGGAAAAAGFRYGDIIVRVDSRPLEEIAEGLPWHPSGQTFRFEVFRGGGHSTLSVMPKLARRLLEDCATQLQRVQRGPDLSQFLLS
jgi:S1-C subfamily serine protease